MVVSYKAQDVPQAGLCSSLLAASTARLDHSEGLRWAQERPSLSLCPLLALRSGVVISNATPGAIFPTVQQELA